MMQKRLKTLHGDMLKTQDQERASCPLSVKMLLASTALVRLALLSYTTRRTTALASLPSRIFGSSGASNSTNESDTSLTLPRMFIAISCCWARLAVSISRP